MPSKLLKRLDVDVRTAMVLLREELIYGLEWYEVYSTNVTTPMLTGNDGTTSSNEPQVFRSTAATFSGTHIGKYLVLYDTIDVNVGIHKITGVIDANTILVQGGVYGSQFGTDVSVSYRVIDPSTVTGDTEFIAQGRAGTAPIWQIRFFQFAADTTQIRIELGPNGGFVGGTRTGVGDSISGTAPTMILTDAGGSFVPTDVGRYLTITGATTSANNGTFLVTSYISSHEVHYTNNSGVAEAFTGNWSFNGTWPTTAITNNTITQSTTATNRWYMKFTDSNIILWNEDLSGAVYNVAYIGAGATRRADNDSSFAIVAAGSSPTFLSNIGSVGSAAGNPQVKYQAIVFGDSSISNIFTGLASSNFDFRNDSADIPIGCDIAGNEDDDRGILLGLQWISDQIPYKSFVDSGRRLLSLGAGLAVEWDGSLAR